MEDNDKKIQQENNSIGEDLPIDFSSPEGSIETQKVEEPSQEEKSDAIEGEKSEVPASAEPEVLNIDDVIEKSDEDPKKEPTNHNGVRAKLRKAGDWMKEKFPNAFGDKGYFYFGLILMGLSVLWVAWSLFNNYFTQLYGWDYEHQFCMFYYDYWDIWHEFFETGQFELYNYRTFLGVDNIGSNAYYGLFDPFVVVMILFPRAWIPQMTAITTFMKLSVTGVFALRYLKYMGIRDWIAKLGAVAIAFSGFMNYMVGFQNVVSGIIYFPLVLLGIEKVIKERKPTCLMVGIAMTGITNFFYLVPICIWGVIYALWRIVQTHKTRNWKQTLAAIGFGVAAVGVGLTMCSWVLLPSFRASSSSGRTSSIGSAYLHSILNNLKTWNIKGVIELMFQPVGMNPGRELMALVSFFYPSGGYLYLPLTYSYYGDGSTGYDAWTASIFCYTVFVILFFFAIIHSIRKKKWSHLVAIVLCCYLLFTTFAYYFFFAFSGNGYGRWFFVLIPEIVYYGCWALQERKEEPKWSLPLATGLAFVGTLMTYFITTWVLDGNTFVNKYGMTYWQSNYVSAGVDSITLSGGTVVVLPNRIWYVYYQTALVVVEGLILIFGQRKKWLPSFLYSFMALEVVVMGNCSFVYGSSWNLQWFLGGPDNYNKTYEVTSKIKDGDSDFYRAYVDTTDDSKNYSMAMGYNSSSSFHSLLNFEVMDYAIAMRISGRGEYNSAYGEEQFNYSWSGYYANKRYATDALLGYRYYVIKNDGYGEWQGKNVPFGSVKVDSMSTDTYTVYKNENVPSLGHAVDKDQLYYLQRDSSEPQRYNAWCTSGDYWSYTTEQVMRNEDFMSVGAIIDDDAKLPEGFAVKTGLPIDLDGSGMERYQSRDIYNSLNKAIYVTNPDVGLFLSDQYYDEGPAYFLNHADDQNVVESKEQIGNQVNIVKVPNDTGHYVLSSSSGTYINEDPSGAYFTFDYSSYTNPVRLYMIGDTYELDEEGNAILDENGNPILKESNTLLSFEYHCFDAAPSDLGTSTFGVFAEGRVKYIVWEPNGPSGDDQYTTVSCQGIYMQERHEEYSDYVPEETFPYGDSIESLSTYLGDEYDLDNVKKTGANSFSFETSYEEDQLVVTQLAYDSGWKVYANGKQVDTYKVNGGFVGFVAPSYKNEDGTVQTVSYTMVYETPYLKEGLIMASVGTFVYFVYMSYDFFRQLKTYKKQLELDEGSGRDSQA